MTNDTHNGLTFKQWLAKVDEILTREIGISHADIARHLAKAEVQERFGYEADAIDDCDFD
jgi:hypothetical protein